MYNFLSEAEKTVIFWLTGTVGKRPNYSITKDNKNLLLLNSSSFLNIKNQCDKFLPSPKRKDSKLQEPADLIARRSNKPIAFRFFAFTCMELIYIAI